MTRLPFAAAGLVACVALAGCAETPVKTVKLGGTVTLDGKPLSEGTVLFYPADKEGAAPTAAPIIDGKYTASAVPIGSYRVAFRAGAADRGQPSGPVDSTYGQPSPTDVQKKDPIPEKYRKPSLPAEAAVDNLALDFALKSN